MATFYAVIRYVPDPIADERINVGVVAWDDTRVESRFVADWRRVESFGKSDVRFLREFESWVAAGHGVGLIGLEGEPRFTPDVATRLAGQWGGVIQLSEPRVSMLGVVETLEAVVRRFLRGKVREPAQSFDREAAIRKANEVLRRLLRSKVGGDALPLVHPAAELRGAACPHRFDFVVGNDNDAAVAAVHAFSFRTASGERLVQQASALAFAAMDVREWLVRKGQAQRVPHLAAFMIPPLKVTQDVDDAYRVFRRAGIPVHSEETMDGWVGSIADHVRAALPIRQFAR